MWDEAEGLAPWLSPLVQGKDSGEDREQLDAACLKRGSWAGAGKAREFSPTAPKWLEEAEERLTLSVHPIVIVAVRAVCMAAGSL